jgi:protein TonB
MMIWRLLRILGATGIALGGTALVFQTLDWMNRAAPPPKKKVAKKTVAFKVKKKRKQKVRRKTPQRQQPRRRTRSARAPIPNLSTNLSGVNFGIPPIGTDALAGAQDKLLGGESALEDVVMTARSVDKKPKPASPVSPSYPPRARAKGIQGFVKFKLLIGTDGGVVEVKVLDSQPKGVFDEAATGAIRQWRFSPALYRGQPVKLWVEQTLRFKLG